ncbi:MAG: hypothetical protein ACP5RF_00400 [Candidatus Micrarchaeia archaeon]
MDYAMQERESVFALVREVEQLEKKILPSPFFRVMRRSNEVDISEIKPELIDLFNKIKKEKYGALLYLEEHDSSRISKVYGIEEETIRRICASMDYVTTNVGSIYNAEIIPSYSVVLLHNDKNVELARRIIDMIIKKVEQGVATKRNDNGVYFKRPPVMFPTYP